MEIRNEHLVGFVAGIGTAALGFYLYKKHQPEVDEFLRSQGIATPVDGSRNEAELTLEELVREKERLEDVIAEREHAATAVASE